MLLFYHCRATSRDWCLFFLMIRRPPRSTLIARRQRQMCIRDRVANAADERAARVILDEEVRKLLDALAKDLDKPEAVSYTHLRAHETVLDLVCRLLLEKKKKNKKKHRWSQDLNIETRASKHTKKRQK